LVGWTESEGVHDIIAGTEHKADSANGRALNTADVTRHTLICSVILDHGRNIRRCDNLASPFQANIKNAEAAMASAMMRREMAQAAVVYKR